MQDPLQTILAFLIDIKQCLAIIRELIEEDPTTSDEDFIDDEELEEARSLDTPASKSAEMEHNSSS